MSSHGPNPRSILNDGGTAIAKEQLDCIVCEMEKVELLESTLQREGCSDEFFTMRTTAERQPNDVVFGGFHVWAQDDAN